jgi:RNA polymerase sigma-32 factor
MLRRLEARDVSLDTRLFDDSSSTLLDTLESTGADQEQTLAATEGNQRRRHAVRIALGVLDARERFIVERRLMADSPDELSLAELGRQLGVSRERARQLEERAKRKLRGRIAEVLAASGDSPQDWVDAA